MLRERLNNYLQRLGTSQTAADLSQYFDLSERRMVARAFVVGVVVWAVIVPLKLAVRWLFALNLSFAGDGFGYLIILLPLLAGALFVAWLVQKWPYLLYHYDEQGNVEELYDVEGDGLERAISLYHASEPTLEHTLQGEEGLEVRWQLPTLSLAGRKSLATLATLGGGGSGGLGASVALIGESIAAGLFKPRTPVTSAIERLEVIGRLFSWWQARTPEELQTAQLSGIAAGMAILLGTPFAGAFFATEVMYRRRPLVEKLVYSLVAALTAYFMSRIFRIEPIGIFRVETLYLPPVDVNYYGLLVLMAVVIAAVSIYFGRAQRALERVLFERMPNLWWRHLTGALITGAIAIGVALALDLFAISDKGLLLVLGPGEQAIGLALAGELSMIAMAVALVAKMLATMATISSGGSAGLLVPSLFFGAMIAGVFADLFAYEPMMFIIPAMTASLVSIVNVPLAAILFVVELFGASYMLPALLVLVVCGILAHNNTIYRTQRYSFDSRQILPGISVRRIPVPPQWAGQTLVQLDVRRRFDVNVIGLVEIYEEQRQPRTLLATASTKVLDEGDVLVVLGRDEQLDALEEAAAG